MSRKMRIFSKIMLGVIVCFLSFTATFYLAIREMRNNRDRNAAADSAGVSVTESVSEAEVSGSGRHFRDESLLNSNFNVYGSEMGYATAEEYELGAVKVIGDENALYKTDSTGTYEIYYIVETNEYVEVSNDGYIRAYFKPSSGRKYFDKK